MECCKLKIALLTAFVAIADLKTDAFVVASRLGLGTDRLAGNLGRNLILFSASTASRSADTDAVKDKAIQSLQKLRSRQLEELLETERLLLRLKTSDRAGAFISDKDGSRSLATVKSILSGVNYGFIGRSEGASFSELKGGGPAFEGYGPPANVWRVGWDQFFRNLNAMRNEYEDEADLTLTATQVELQTKLKDLRLNATAIWEKERANGPIQAPLIIKIPYLLLCFVLDFVFENKYPPARFFLLETVARMPYFSYITMLHLYETLGFWRRSADIKRVHFAEELNEFRHLLIMESLGGDQRWWVRFLAQHSAIAYYLGLCLLWLVSPSLSYGFSELLETHAVFTYGQFLDDNEKLLKELPPTLSAVEYYSFGTSDPFYAEIQTNAMASGGEIRRPGEKMECLYDVFAAIRADEGDHVSAMRACLDPTALIRSPSIERRILFGASLVAAFGFLLSTGESGDTTRLGEIVNSIGGDTSEPGIIESISAAIAGVFRDFSSDEENLMEGVETLETMKGPVIGEANNALIQFLESIMRILL